VVTYFACEEETSSEIFLEVVEETYSDLMKSGEVTFFSEGKSSCPEIYSYWKDEAFSCEESDCEEAKNGYGGEALLGGHGQESDYGGEASQETDYGGEAFQGNDYGGEVFLENDFGGEAFQGTDYGGVAFQVNGCGGEAFLETDYGGELYHEEEIALEETFSEEVNVLEVTFFLVETFSS